MKVFISWSGDLSKELAQALREWLRPTLNAIRPYCTLNDVQKGSLWDSEISKELEGSHFCIIAMTRQALESKWIVFEAGAISKWVEKSRICPICFDIEATDIEYPLARFQGMKWNRGEFRKLICQMNAASGDVALSESELHEVFEERWPKLETKINGILEHFVPSRKPEELRTNRDLIEEILQAVRGVQSMAQAEAQAQAVRDSMVESLMAERRARREKIPNNLIPAETRVALEAFRDQMKELGDSIRESTRSISSMDKPAGPEKGD